MQIIIPMSGFGERFRRAGYELPKPLIEMEGKPIIAHVIDMFPGETDFSFICNQDHLDNPNYKMKEILKKYCPSGKIHGIQPHKLGPVFAVQQIQNSLKMDVPVIVNYCDFTCYWDWYHFKKFVKDNACAGAIPAYKGFHPHSLGSTNYAYLKESEGWVIDIQEKQPYTDNRMDEYASSGTYYFSSAKTMIEEFDEIVEAKMDLGGEYYVSLAYKRLSEQSKSVAVYPLQHFMQWGTPEDVKEYNYWSQTFSNLVDLKALPVEVPGSTVIPMAGLGQRFANEGYAITKPLIPVSGSSMVVQATNDLPKTLNYVFVVRADMPDYSEVISELEDHFPNGLIKTISHVTDGQACTAIIGVDALEILNTQKLSPVTIGTCDSGALYNNESFLDLLNDSEVDVIVWGVRGYVNAIRYPEMYGWIDSDNGVIRSVSVKKPLDNPMVDPIVLGTFTFKKAEDFVSVTDSLIKREGRVNGEFYMDSCIEDAIQLGLKCVLFEVDSYLCWGTPNDLKTFEYWQSCFHLWGGHPYQLLHDKRVLADDAERLKKFFIEENPTKEFELGRK
jgi:NDP-sugar pyrophosphorylase family protein